MPIRVVISKSYLTAIADAIRAVTGGTEPLTIDQMIAAISAM